MITFATLFLGLVLGPQGVEVVVGEEVAAVELRLGGEPAGRLEGPPWRARVDFGRELVPRQLVAVALGENGEELGRTSQWIHLPRDPAEATLALEGMPDTAGSGGRSARLTWESTAGAEPVAVRVAFDGRPLEVEDPHRLRLPPHDPDQLHFLRAELDFPGGVTSVAELAFGGLYAGEASAELTAVPIFAPRRLPRHAALEGSFRRGGEPLAVRAIEKGPAEVVMVVDRSYAGDLFEIRHANWERGRTLEDLRFAAALAADVRLRFVDPMAARQSGVDLDYSLFPVTGELDAAEGGVYFHLVRQRFRARGFQRLADAVAVAGLQAAGRHRRRAVVLVLSAEPTDDSRLDVDVVRRYLERLRVPLVVWSSRSASSSSENAPAPDAEPWGTAVDISTMSKLEKAVRGLDRLLDEQATVWLEGIHPPHEIELGDAPRGIRLVP